MSSWLSEPYKGRKSAFIKALIKYFADYQFRVNARVRHINGAQGAFAKYLAERLRAKHKIIYAANAKAGAGLTLVHPFGVVIGRDVVIGDNVRIYQNVTLGQNRDGFPHIGNDVIIYANAVIVGSINVGNGAIIGAGCVVTKDVPDGAIVGGVPGKVIRLRDKDSDGEFY